MYFWSVSWSTNCPVYFSFFLVDQFFFWLTKNKFGRPKKNWSTKNMKKWFLVDQKKNWLTKKMRNWFLFDQKKIGWTNKCEIDRTIGRPKRLTKSTWTPLICISLVIGGKMSLFFYEAAKSLRSSWPFSTSTDANCQWSGSYYSGLSTLTKCHCESVGLHEFYHHSNNWSFHKK